MNLVNIAGTVYDQYHVPAGNTALNVYEVGTNTLVPLYASNTSGTPLTPTGLIASNPAGAFNFYVESTKVVYLVVDPLHVGHTVSISSGGSSGGSTGGTFNVPGNAHEVLQADGSGGMNALTMGTAGQSLVTDGVNVFWGTPTAPLAGSTGTITNLGFTANGQVAAGQTAFNTGTGFWLGAVGGVPKVSIGSPAGQHLTWDGTNLQLQLPAANIVSTAGPIANIGNLASANTVPAAGFASTAIRFNTDGTISLLEADGWVDGGNWYSPTTAGIGASYAINFTPVVVPGPLGSTDAVNTWHALSTARSLQVDIWGATAPAVFTYDTYRIRISSSLTGTPVVAKGRWTSSMALV